MINPLLIFYLLILIGLILLSLKRKRSGKIIIMTALIMLLAATTRFIPMAMIKSLEWKYPPVSDSVLINIRGTCDIIVLGGGHIDDMRLKSNNQLSNSALSRLAEGIRIHRMIPGSRLVLSGYKGRSMFSQAQVFYQAALLLGTDSSSMVMQSSPANTLMEAEAYAEKKDKSENLIVVTSASHMPRAMMMFRNKGLSPVAAPCDYLAKKGSVGYTRTLLPSAIFLRMTELCLHEAAGILWYRMGGK